MSSRMGSAPNCDSNGNRKMGIMATDGGVHTVAAMANKKVVAVTVCTRLKHYWEWGKTTGKRGKSQQLNGGGGCPIFHVFLPYNVVQLYLNIN